MESGRPPPPRTVLITGASRGLGAALARLYASDGLLLGLTARSDTDRLAAVARDCESKGAEVVTACFDVTDAAATRAWVGSVEERRAVDLVIANAGRFSGNGPVGRFEPLGSALDQISVNLTGAITTIDAVLPGMRTRKSGQIALISSLAALQPLADAPAYSATKAGLGAYGEALRELLAPEGISVSLVYPGNIATAQTAHHVGELPLMMSTDRAARIIKSGLDRRRTEIAFPRRLLWLIRAGKLLPWRLRALAGRSLRFHVDDKHRHG